MALITRLALMVGALLLLPSCLVTPGKFDSTLDIRADRSFRFTYKGEVIASDFGKSIGDSDTPLGEDMPTEEESALIQTIALGSKGDKAGTQPPPLFGNGTADRTTKMHAIAAALLKEKGFRGARYLGEDKFEIDYAISGRLDHAFVFPFNIDAQIVFPFIAIEMRGEDRVRVKAPGYANSSDQAQGAMGSDAAAKALDGRFTLTTNAAIVSQNQEDGPSTVAEGEQIVWKVNSLTTEAPMAVLKFPVAPERPGSP